LRHGQRIDVAVLDEAADEFHEGDLPSGMAPLPGIQSLSNRDFNLGIAAWRGRVQSSDNPINVTAQDGPLGVAKDDDGNFPGGQVLLMPHILVGRHEHLEASGFGCIEQGAVFKPLPPALNRFDNGMSFQGITQRRRRAVIKEDEHLPLTPRAAAGVEAGRGFAPRTPAPRRSAPASGETIP
jgi:hypothetical protein